MNGQRHAARRASQRSCDAVAIHDVAARVPRRAPWLAALLRSSEAAKQLFSDPKQTSPPPSARCRVWRSTLFKRVRRATAL